MRYQAAFQAIANANGGTRAALTPGYDASVDYVVETMEAAGWNVEPDEFQVRVAPSSTRATTWRATRSRTTATTRST